MRFSVWAPLAERVELEFRGARLPLRPAGAGWWEVEAEAAAGDRYGYLLDGDGPFPDPRSRLQPDGVHGLSAVYDHSTFGWSDADWKGVELADAIVYELHVGTFTPEGTFEAAIAHLDHLVGLGVTAVELLPVAEFSGDRGWGYDGVDPFAVHHSYGGPDGLKRLVDACHARGLAVVMDCVYNHLGPEGNYLGRFGPYFTDRYSTPWGAAVNFDGPWSDHVREFVFENALMWLADFHCDGLRLDAVHAIWDFSAKHLLEELMERVRGLEPELGRRLFVIAESDLNDPRVVASGERGGYSVDAQWSDDLHHALHAVLTGERQGYYEDFGEPEQLLKALRQAFVYDGVYSRHRRRRHGRRPEGIAPGSFLAYAQNHDQVGNRAAGERLSHLVPEAKLRAAAAVVLLSPFVPMLFQGEEWGAGTPFQFFSSHQDEALAGATSEGRMSEFRAFGWSPEEVPDPQDPRTYLRSKLDWAELERQPHRSLLEWHRKLIELRKRTQGAAVSVELEGQALTIRRGPLSARCDLAGGGVELSVDEPG